MLTRITALHGIYGQAMLTRTKFFPALHPLLSIAKLLLCTEYTARQYDLFSPLVAPQ
jgi:hypothetical protein